MSASAPPPMTTGQKENLQLAILRAMDLNRTRFGLQIAAITTLLVQFACQPTEDELLDALDYLEMKKLVEECLKGISKANRAWRLSDAGRAFLDERGF